MKLTTLGGAAAWPNPGQGCSSYLITMGDATLLLDCGPGTLLELRKHVAYEKLDGIVISHLHADHFLDLVAYRYGLEYGPARPDHRIPVWLPPGGTEFALELANVLNLQREASDTFWSSVFDLLEYSTLDVLHINEFRISFHPTQHFIPCWAIRVESSKGAIVYTADAGNIDMLVEFARNAAILIVEANSRNQHGVPEEERGHLTPREAGELAHRSNAGLAVLTHLWSERSDDEVIDIAANWYSGPIAIAKPGSKFDVK